MAVGGAPHSFWNNFRDMAVVCLADDLEIKSLRRV